MNVCTLTDSSYLAKGLTMRQSLIDLGVEHTVYWLCLDDETYNRIFTLDNVEAYKLSNLEKIDSTLQKLKSNPATRYGGQRENYIWSLAPYFINFLLKNEIEPGEFITYIDSDIFFYNSPQIILDTIGERSVGIHTHRFGLNRKKLDVGWYNVGVIVFKNDRAGRLISELWKHWMVDASNPYYDEYGTCGDQKYLELFVEMFPKQVCVFDEEGPISHLAPWCTHLEDKPVIFFHFSHFVYSLEKNSWNDNVREWRGEWPEWKPSRHSHIRPYYELYFDKIKEAHKLII